MFKFLCLLSTICMYENSPSCSCAMTIETPAEQTKSYEFIFKGEITKIDSVFYVDEYLINSVLSTRDSGIYFTKYLVSLKVKNFWKGKTTEKIVQVITGLGGSDCGYKFTLNKDYIIYANMQPLIIIDNINQITSKFKSHDAIFLETSICTRTTDKIKQEEKILNKIF